MGKRSLWLILAQLSTSVCLTLGFTLGLANHPLLAHEDNAPTGKRPVSDRPEQSLKCGYRAKQIALTFPSTIEPPEESEQSVSRTQEERNLRCAGHQPPILLTALIPESNIGITVEANPSFLFYIPEANLESTTGEFVLYDQDSNPVYSETVPLNDPDSIIQVKLPKSNSTSQLELDKTYFWSFEILFDPIDRSDSVGVSGWIKRIQTDSTIQTELATVSAEKKPSIYAANGIWYEALTTLAELRCSQPENRHITSDWESLLEQVGLSEIAKKPLAQCQ